MRQIWEYKIVEQYFYVNQLNKLGLLGWELAAVIPHSTHPSFIFKMAKI